MRLLAVLLLSLGAGCAEILFEPEVLGGGGAATTSASGGAGGVAPSGGGGAGGGPDAGAILHVDGTLGDDDNTGLTDRDPKLTIRAALAAALAAAGDVGEIRVCAGTYEETLVLDAEWEPLPALALRGGYDCGSWERLPDFGPPVFATQTVLGAAMPEDTTLTISGALGPSFVVDGFRIEAGKTNVEPSRAVLIDGGAALLLRNNDIDGGAGSGELERSGSLGVDVADAAPILESNRIHGGDGAYDGEGHAASIALYIHPEDASAASIVRNNLIFGGNGVHAPSNLCGEGSAGVFIGSGQPIVEANAIWGGGGANSGAGCRTSVGVLTRPPARPEILRNAANGPGPPFPISWSDSAGGSRGMLLFSSALVDGNRIYGGPGYAAATFSVALGLAGPDTIVVNNMIYGGNAEGLPGTVVGGIFLDPGASSAIVAHNTIYTGPAAAGGSSAVFVQGVTGLELDKNVFFGDALASSPISIQGCPDGKLSSFRDNVFFDFAQGDVLIHAAGCASLPSAHATTDEAEAALAIGAGAAGNREVAPVNGCGSQPDCVELGCTDAICAGTVIANWTGYDSLFEQGWTLDPMLTCTDWSTMFDVFGVETDAFEVERTSPTTIGAAEQDDCQ